ncbi:DpnI domain-containing protein [Terriglobus albidus]|uniref:DpnI domain-containing protein n=1 Tax=Terriglobus albidus TaxID=1592106 RepID=UPI0037DA2B98
MNPTQKIYINKSQIARVTTESWIATNQFCLACDNDHLIATKANTQARDFECSFCGHAYELKSSSKPFGKRVVDGAYASMMRRIQSGSIASFLLMEYSLPWSVRSVVG